MKAINIIARLDVLEGQRKVVEHTWQIIEKFVVPYRGQFFRTQLQEQQVEWRKREIYDDTAVKACRRLAANLHSNLTSPSMMWFSLSFRDEDLADDSDAVEWLEECGKRVYSTLQKSNFNLEISEGYTDLASFATMVIVEEVVDEVDWDGIDFQAVPQRECYFEEGADGTVLRFYRKIEYTPLQLVDKFGKENLPDDIIKRAEGHVTGDSKEEVVFSIYNRPNRKNADTSSMLAPLARPYGFKYVLRRGKQQLGDEGGYYEMPAFVTRFAKTSGSMWGHGPAHIGLADILTLNEMVYLDQRAQEKAVDPPSLTTENGLMSDLDLDAGGLTVVADIDGLKPYDNKARFDVSENRIVRMQESVVEAFYGDALELKESPQMTLGEVERRWQIMQKLLGPTVGRIQSDLLDPMVQRTFNILLRAGQLPEIPEVVRASDADMEIEYTGPIPRSQKMEQAQLIEGWMAGIAEMAELYPDMLDVPDAQAAAREVGILTGVPAKVMRSENEAKVTKREREAKQAEAAQAETAGMEGAAMESLGKGQQAMDDAGMTGAPEGDNVLPFNPAQAPA